MSCQSGNTRIAGANLTGERRSTVGPELRDGRPPQEIDLRDAVFGEDELHVDSGRASTRPTKGRAVVSEPMTAGQHHGEVRSPQPPRPYLSQRIAIRTLDLVVSIMLLSLLLPVMLAIAIAIKVDSPGPVFFRSTRVGHQTPTFRAWKFRSMVVDAEAQLLIVLASDPTLATEYNTYHKLKQDPRLTRVGRLIRRTSLDEVPQLLNVLVGQMSVVGPRPNLLSESHVFGQYLDEVLRVRPGLTGLWQVSGRSQLSLSDRVTLDLRYVRTRTLTGDMRICMKTFFQLCRPWRHGAY